MRRVTLGSFRAAGGSLLVGICQGDLASTAAIVNLAQERLVMDPMAPEEGWWGGWVKMVFNIQSISLSAYIVTPHDIARIILMDVCRQPVRIRNGFYEYLEFGIGLQPNQCNPQVCAPSTMQAFERDTVSTLKDFATSPQLLRVFVSDNADLGRRIVFQGADQNGVTILNVDQTSHAATLGETVYLKAPFADTANQYSTITGILKDATLGPIDVFMLDPVTGAQTLLTSMEPNETTAQYRRYFVNGLPCGCCNTPGGPIQVSAQCKLDFVPAYSDSDYLIIQSIPALMEEVQSIRYSRMDSPQAPALELKHHAKALSILNGQLDHFLGKVNTAVTVPIFGSDRLTPQPR